RTSQSLAVPTARPEMVISRLYDSSQVRSAGAFSVAAAALGWNRSFLAKSSKTDRTPDYGDTYDGSGRSVEDDGGIDEIGNPRRSGGGGGPDDASDPDGGRGGDPFFGTIALPLIQKLLELFGGPKA
ncbi:MAG: hypothetical protein AAB262_02500, partial [Elusimicrobiota bacterium]